MAFYSIREKASQNSKCEQGFRKTPVRSLRTLGEKLRSARFAHGLTLDDISQTLVIQKRHLERIENDEFGLFHEEVYLENILRTYSTYVGLSWKDVYQWYQASKPLYCPRVDDKIPSALERKVRASHFWIIPLMLRKGACAMLITACFSYLVFLGYSMMRSPELLIVSPQNNSLSATDAIEVVGRVDTRAQVNINGEQVAKSEGGVFHQVVGLQEGVNIITVTAAKKFGWKRSENRTVIFSKTPFDPVSERVIFAKNYPAFIH